MRTLRCFFSLSFMLIGTLVHAQSSITTAGNNAIGTGGTTSYTIGQVVYKTHSGVTGSVAEGVQQRYTSTISTGIEQSAVDLKIMAFPNPTNDYLVLEIAEKSVDDFSYELIDLNGKILLQGSLSSSSKMNLNQLSSATYFIRVRKNKELIKTFKILKN